MMNRSAKVVVAVLLFAAPALGANPKALKRVEDMTRVAIEELDLGDAAAAEMRLSEAVAIAKSSGLEKHEVTARAQLYLGAAHAAQKNKAEAVKALKAAFALAPHLTIPDKLKTPDLTAALTEARGVAEAVEITAPQPEGGIQHVPVDSTAGGKPLTVEANVGADVK